MVKPVLLVFITESFYVQIQMLCEKHQFPKFVETDFPIVPTKLYVASQVDMVD